jgi:hypothetical protein
LNFRIRPSGNRLHLNAQVEGKKNNKRNYFMSYLITQWG